MTFNFTSQELELLQRIVRQYYMNLRSEIYHTEASTFKMGLKDEEAQLQRLLEKIEAEMIPAVEA
jgi:Ser/Thr protein kinase RdoA (MazF antagonist)